MNLDSFDSVLHAHGHVEYDSQHSSVTDFDVGILPIPCSYYVVCVDVYNEFHFVLDFLWHFLSQSNHHSTTFSLTPTHKQSHNSLSSTSLPLSSFLPLSLSPSPPSLPPSLPLSLPPPSLFTVGSLVVSSESMQKRSYYKLGINRERSSFVRVRVNLATTHSLSERLTLSNIIASGRWTQVLLLTVFFVLVHCTCTCCLCAHVLMYIVHVVCVHVF